MINETIKIEGLDPKSLARYNDHTAGTGSGLKIISEEKKGHEAVTTLP
jgi:hypothetical protein